MTMTMTVPTDSYLGVSLRKGWDGDMAVLVHQDPSLSLPLPALHGVATDLQARAWADALGVACLGGQRRVPPRRRGNPLIRRTSRRTARRRHVLQTAPARIRGLEMCVPG